MLVKFEVIIMIKTVAEKVGLQRQYSSLECAIEKAAVIDYSLQTYALMFFTYAIVGKIWEVILFLAVQQEFVNSGFLHGPWCPIYGVGGVMALELFKNIRRSPEKTFAGIMAVAGIMEYATHAATERIFGITWWDYSEYLLNINGRICIEGLVVFGMLGCVSIYVIAPRINSILVKIKNKWKTRMLCILTIVFVIDMAISFVSPNINNIY